MARIAGVNIPQNKVVNVGLTYIYGIGPSHSNNICKNLKVPLLILSRAKDTVISTEMRNSLIAALPRANEVVFPEAGHASYAEYPDQFNYQVTEFSKKVWNLNGAV
mgnify:CR=1 FL=1